MNKHKTDRIDEKVRKVIQGYVDWAKNGGWEAENYEQFWEWCKDDGIPGGKEIYRYYLFKLGKDVADVDNDEKTFGNSTKVLDKIIEDEDYLDGDIEEEEIDNF